MIRDDEKFEGTAPGNTRTERLRHALTAARSKAYALLRRALPNESQHLFAVTLLVGVVCGFVAVAFHLAIRASEALLIERALRAPS